MGGSKIAGRIVSVLLVSALIAGLAAVPGAGGAGGNGAIANASKKKKMCKQGFKLVKKKGKKKCVRKAVPSNPTQPIAPAPAPANIVLNPTSFDFPDTPVPTNSAPVPFSATNTGGQPTGVILVNMLGADASEFQAMSSADTCTGVVLAPAASCTLMVRFQPASNMDDKSATLQVSATPGGVATAALSGDGT